MHPSRLLCGVLCAHDLDPHERLLPFDPCVMPGQDRVRHGGNNRCPRAVAHLHREASGNRVADVRGLAGGGLDHRLDASLSRRGSLPDRAVSFRSHMPISRRTVLATSGSATIMTLASMAGLVPVGAAAAGAADFGALPSKQ